MLEDEAIYLLWWSSLVNVNKYTILLLVGQNAVAL